MAVSVVPAQEPTFEPQPAAPLNVQGLEEGQEEPVETKNLLGLPAAPLTEPLVTDRPDATESTDAVPWGHTQIELGWTFTYDREHDERTRDHVLPELLMRIGLAENLELRLGWEGVALQAEAHEERSDQGRRFTAESHETSATDMEVAFKIKLADQEGLLPHFGAIAGLSLPTGGHAVTSGDVDPSVVLLWAYDVTDWFAVAGNILLGTPTSEDGRFFQTGATLSTAFALTDELGMYTEYFGFYPSDRGSDCEHSLNGGFTYLITDNVQVDVRVGFGLNEQAPDFFTGTGLAIRF